MGKAPLHVLELSRHHVLGLAVSLALDTLVDVESASKAALAQCDDDTGFRVLSTSQSCCWHACPNANKVG